MATFEPQDVVAHARFVRALAGELARDASEADDLAARTMAEAIARRPDSGPGLRVWLRRVLWRTFRRERRDDERRGRRELAAARTESLPAAADLAAQMELQRLLGEAFTQLDEPWKSTLFRRYFHDQTPTQIAAETATPLATVKSRLQRGLEQLRARLDATDGGGRGQWLAALVPWISGTSFGGPTLVATTISLKSKVAAVAVAAVLVASASLVLLEPWKGGSTEGPLPLTPSPASVAAAATTDAAAADKNSAPTATPERAPVAIDPATLPFASGIVVDSAGAPLAGVAVIANRLRRVTYNELVEQEPLRLDHGERDRLATTGADGRFVVAEPGVDLAALFFLREGFGAAEWFDFAVDRAANQEHTVVLKPGVALRGHVRDTAGAPIAGALLDLAAASRSSNELPKRTARHLSDAPSYLFFSAGGWPPQKDVTDVSGAFRFTSIPDRQFRLSAMSYGYAWSQFDDARLAASSELEMKRSALLVDVADVDSGAPVRAGLIVTDSKDGRVLQQVVPWLPIDIEHSVIGPPGRLALDVGFAQPYHSTPGWLSEAKDGELAVQVHVIADGFRGDLLDVTLSTKEEPRHLRVALTPRDGSETDAAISGRVTGAAHATVVAFSLIPHWDQNYLEAGEPLLTATCDDDGTFRFFGLPKGRYRLRARAPGVAAAWSDVDAPIRDVRLELAASAVLEVAVHDRAGTPVKDVVVHAQLAAGGRAWAAKSDAAGIATLAELPSGKLRVGAFPELRYDLANDRVTFPLHESAFTDPALVEVKSGERTRIARAVVERVAVRLHFERDDGSPVTSVKFEFDGVEGTPIAAFREWDRLRAFRPEIDSLGDADASLYPGHYRFRASETTVARAVEFDVPDSATASVTIRLPSLGPTGTIAGRVVDLDSHAPITRRKVFAFLEREGADPLDLGVQLTNDEGRFRYADVPPGTVRLTVCADARGDTQRWVERDPDSPYGTATQSCTIEAGRENAVEIALPAIHAKDPHFRTVELDARVTEAATGKPLERACVAVELKIGATTFDVATVYTDADGRIHEKLYEGPGYTITVWGPWKDGDSSESPYAPQHFALAPTEGVLTIDAVLKKK